MNKTFTLCAMFCVFLTASKAQMKIGASTPPASTSILELESSTQGFVPPRIALTSTTARSPLAAIPLDATIVFNTNASIGAGIGLYIWYNSQWNFLSPSSSATSNWSTLGNSGTTSAINFLGTTDNNGLSFATNNTRRMLIDSLGDMALGSTAYDPNNRERLLVDYGNTTSNTLANFRGNTSNYLQLNVQNTNSGANSSTDIVATADNGTDSTEYVDFGINSSTYAPGTDNFGGPNDGYLYSYSRNLIIGTEARNSDIIFLVDGGSIRTNAALRIDGVSSNIVVGKGDSTNVPVGNVIRGPNAVNTNIGGGKLTLKGGAATGTASGGDLSLFGGQSPSGNWGNLNIGTGISQSDVYIGNSLNNIFLPAFTTPGGIFYNNSTGGQLASTTAGTAGQVLTSTAGGIPTWSTPSSGTVTSVGLSMPTAFTVSNSPLTSSGTISVTGAGTTTQYIRGDGMLATFPTTLSSIATTLPIYNTGTATAPVIAIQGTAGDKGGVLYSTGAGTSATFLSTASAANQVLLSGASGAAPSWGAATIAISAENGLNVNTTSPASTTAPAVELGGSLVRSTTITQPSSYNLIHNLTGTGDFQIQKNGTDVVHVYSANANVGVNAVPLGTQQFTAGTSVTTNTAIVGQNTATTGAGAGTGVLGTTTQSAGFGVQGANSTSTGYAVYANNTNGVTGAGLKVTGTSNLTGTTSLGTASATSGSLVYNNSTNANTVAINTGATTATYSLVLPTAVGAAGQQLSISSLTGTAATLGWANYIPAGAAWLTTGNSSTAAGSNFLGTTDNTALEFKVNSVLSGYLGTSTTASTSFGYAAAAGTGTTNTTAIGSNAQAAHQNGTALGANSNAAHSYGTSIGAASAATIDTATAVGSNTIASAYNASAIGGFSDATANGASAIGGNASANSAYSTAAGYNSTASGGVNQIAIGNGASSTSSGANDIAIGTGATVASNYTNSTAIGNAATVGASNTLVLGGTGTNAVNVGVGTITPLSPLDVNGTINTGKASTTNGAVQFTNSTNANTATINTGATATTYSLTLPTTVGAANQGLSISSLSGTNATLGWNSFLTAGSSWLTTGNAGTTASTAAYGSAANNNFIGTTDANDFVVATSGLERMRVLSSGNVGIGTATPGAALNVVKSAPNADVLTVQNTSTAGFSSIDFYSTAGALSSTFGFANSTVGGIFNSRAYMNSYNNDFVLTRNSTEYNLFIQGSSGNVGINTLTPVTPFDVNGKMNTGKASTTNGGLQFSNSTNANTVTLNSSATTATYAVALPVSAPAAGQVLSASSASQLAWTTAGTVTSVGVNAPLSVINASSTPTISLVGAAGSVLYGTGSASAFNTAGASNTVLHGGTTPAFSQVNIAAGGDVTGILPIANGGTNLSTAPSNGQILIGNGTGYNLSTITAGTGISVTNSAGGITIANTAAATSGWNTIGNTGTTASTAAIGSTINNNFIGTTDAKDFVLATQNLERLRISSAGNVGIGNNLPTQTLDVNGTINTGKASATNGAIQFSNNSNSNTVTFSSGATSGTYAVTLPVAAPTTGQVLTASSATQLAWSTPASGSGSGGWALTGNSAVAGNFLGTTNNIPLVFKVSGGQTAYQDNLNNVIFGSQTPGSLSGSSNLGVGYQVMNGANSGSNNIAMGSQTLSVNSGSYNLALGYQAMGSNTGSNNIGFGTQSLNSNTGGAYNLAFGYQSMNGTNSGSNNIAFGQNALNVNSGSYNLAFGFNVMSSNTGSNNFALGQNALNANNAGTYNFALGYQAMGSTNSGAYNMAFGQNALNTNSGQYNFGFGYQALNANTGTYNFAFGSGALKNNSSSGTYNFVSGYNALTNNTSGSYNNVLGYNSASNSTSGSYNTVLSANSFQNNTTGGNNISIGQGALNTNSTGNYNTALGYQADISSNALNNTTAIGYQAKVGVSNGTAIGYQATVGTGATSTNAIVIGSTSANVGIGTSTPNTGASLDVNGTFKDGTQGTVNKNLINFSTAIVATTLAAGSSGFVSSTTDVTFTIPSSANYTSSTQATVLVTPNFDLPNSVSIAYARMTSTSQIKVRFINASSAIQIIAAGTLYFTIHEF